MNEGSNPLTRSDRSASCGRQLLAANRIGVSYALRAVRSKGAEDDDQLDTLWSSRALPADHQTFIPPSTTISTPVTYELSSEARNKATFATSSGRPRRPSSVLPSIALAHSGSFSCCRV